MIQFRIYILYFESKHLHVLNYENPIITPQLGLCVAQYIKIYLIKDKVKVYNSLCFMKFKKRINVGLYWV